MQLSLTYSDISLVPRELSAIASRNDVDTTIRFLGRDLLLPVLSAPMKTVTGYKMARRLTTMGCLPVLMRTNDASADLREFQDSAEVPGAAVVSIGATEDFLERAAKFIQAGARILCIDTANGFSALVGHAVNQLRKSKVPIHIIAGNVGSVEGYTFLARLGVNAVRVGIGSGSACSTSVATGVGVGQASLVREIAEWRATQPNAVTLPAIIADGGIKEPGDIAKAIALGADVVMVGRYFAGSDESPGEIIEKEGQKYKKFAGEASRASKRPGARHIEGVETLVPYSGPVKDTIEDLEDGLKSSMAYMNRSKLDTFRNLPNKYFVRLTENARIERTPHVLR